MAVVSRPLPERDGIVPTVLYARKRDVQRDNDTQLARLDPASRQVYRAEDSVSLHEDAPPWVTEAKLLGNSFFKSDCQAVSEIELRTGAQVMLLKNEMEPEGTSIPRSQRLVNGSRGVVIGWDWALQQSDDRYDLHPGKKARETKGHGGALSLGEEEAVAGGGASGGGGDSYDDAELAHGGGGGGTCDDTELARKGLCDYSSEPPELPAAAPPPGALCAASGVPQLFPVAACCVFVL
jgi:hypothetical protein